MRIALLAPQLIPTHPAGGQMLQVVRELAGEHNFTVFGHSIDDSVKSRVGFQRLPIPILRPRLITYLVQFLLYRRAFRRLMLDEQFDVVQSIEGSAPLATVVTMQFCAEAALDLVRRGVLQYAGIRNPYYRLLYRVGSEMERTVVNNAHLKAVIAVSEGLKRELVSYYQPSVEPLVVPNSVNVDRFSNAGEHREMTRRELGLRDGELVGSTCALGDWSRKGLDVLVKGVALLPRNTTKILVIGGGPTRIYRQQCEERGLADSFIFTGFTRDIERYYGAADFFIFPTAYESFGLVAFEAAAAGLPLLTTQVSGVGDFVEEGVNGLFIEREPKSIANAVTSLADDRAKLKAMGRSAKHRVQEFRVENMVHAYRRLYNEFV